MNRPSRLSGFTIVEVVLVLAITGLLSVMIMAGLQGGVNNQRYNDTVYSFRDFLQNQYFQVANVGISARSDDANACGDDPIQRGRTDCFVVGKLLVLEPDATSETRSVVSYDLISTAPVVVSTYDDDTTLVKDLGLKADPVSKQVYKLEWDATVTEPNLVAMATVPVKSVILIIRSPLSGSIRTYNLPLPLPAPAPAFDVGNLSSLTNVSDLNHYLSKPATFCLTPNGISGVKKRAIFVRANGSNASAVELAPTDVNVNGALAVECK